MTLHLPEARCALERVMADNPGVILQVGTQKMMLPRSTASAKK
jgi:hypothetical protein